MAKKTSNWFSHDCDATNDKKIVMLIAEYGYEGYGYWWRILEILRKENNYKYCLSDAIGYLFLAKELMCPVERVKQFIDDCVNKFLLLKTNGKYIWNVSLMERMEHMDAKKEILSERGKKGGKAGAVVRGKKEQQVEALGTTSEQQVEEMEAKESKPNETKPNDSNQTKVNSVGSSSSPVVLGDKVLPERSNIYPMMYAAIQDVSFTSSYFDSNQVKDLAQLRAWLEAFNKWLSYRGETVKTEADYRTHFKNWFLKQDRTLNPARYDPIPRAIPIPAQKTVAQILAAQHKSDEELLKLLEHRRDKTA